MHPERRSAFGMPTKKMKRKRTLICLVLAVLMLSGSAFAASAENLGDDVEEVFDAVAQAEADTAATAAKAAEEAEKVNDVIDLYKAPEESSSEGASQSGNSPDEEGESFAVSGPILALVVAVILIVGAGFVIVASNRKIKAINRAR